jgi:hypothetical protein
MLICVSSALFVASPRCEQDPSQTGGAAFSSAFVATMASKTGAQDHAARSGLGHAAGCSLAGPRAIRTFQPPLQLSAVADLPIGLLGKHAVNPGQDRQSCVERIVGLVQVFLQLKLAKFDVIFQLFLFISGAVRLR